MTCWKFRFLVIFWCQKSIHSLKKIYFSHLQVTQRTVVGALSATLASWPCWAAASTPASSFWALLDFLSKNERENLKTTTFKQHPQQPQFLGIAGFFVNFSSKSQLRVIQKLHWQNFNTCYTTYRFPYIDFLNHKRKLILYYCILPTYLPTYLFLSTKF